MKIMGSLVFLLLLMNAGMCVAPSHTSPVVMVQAHAAGELPAGSGTIPVNLTTIVGGSGDTTKDAMNFLAAVPLTLRSGPRGLSSGLLLFDDSEGFETPLEEWLGLTESVKELVFVGNIENPAHTSLKSICGSFYEFDGPSHTEIAADLAETMFQGTENVVLAYGEPSGMFETNTTIVDTSRSLGPMTSTTINGRTGSSSNWEWKYVYEPSGGGAIFYFQSSTSYIWFDLLSRVGGEYYSMDYPYLDGRTVRYPYEENPDEEWVLHVVDLYEYDRSMSFQIGVSIPSAHFYSVDVAPGEDCRIDLEVAVLSGQRAIDLNVLDPSGNIVLDANRYALMPGIGRVSSLTASLAHPAPGTYKVYVSNVETVNTDYSIRITKRVVDTDWTSAGVSAANGASVASALGAPLLYTGADDLPVTTATALANLSPTCVYIIDPLNSVLPSVRTNLESQGFVVTEANDFLQLQVILAQIHGTVPSQGKVTLYDGQGCHFAAAGLSAAYRRGIAVPFHFGDSQLMTLSQIPEQLSYHREFAMPFIASFSIIDVWTDQGTLSHLNPRYESMKQVSDRFYQWLYSLTGINAADHVVIIAAFDGPGTTLPPSFDRAIMGRCLTGRYPSVSVAATCAELIRTVFRIPLQSEPSRSLDALGSYLAYSRGQEVRRNNLDALSMDNSAQFGGKMSGVGLQPIMQVGPQITATLSSSPYLWTSSLHGSTGQVLYKDDGFVACMNVDAWRGYESGGTADQPDSDSDNIVNPPDSYLQVQEMHQLLGETDLDGMIAVLDACQLACSYAPAELMEAGADSVVACWSDCLIGPSDLLEYYLLDCMASLRSSLAESLVLGLQQNSHIYSLDAKGKDFYVSTSDIYIIAASSQQHMLFGNPDVTLYDWSVAPYQFVDRMTIHPQANAAKAIPGTTHRLPFNLSDSADHVYEVNDLYHIAVFGPDSLLLFEDHVPSGPPGSTFCDVAFPQDAAVGEYEVVLTSRTTSLSSTVTIVLSWDIPEISDVSVMPTRQLSSCIVTVTVLNALDVNVSCMMTFLIQSVPVYSTNTVWTPGNTTQKFSFPVEYIPFGEQILSVRLELPYGPADQQSILDSPLLVTAHWTQFGIIGVIPGLVIVTSAFGLRAMKRSRQTLALGRAWAQEQDLTYEPAFDAYEKNGLYSPAIRVALSAGFPQPMASRLVKHGSEVAQKLEKAGDDLEAAQKYGMAASVFSALQIQDRTYRNQLKSVLQTGDRQEASKIISEIATSEYEPILADIVTELEASGSTDWALGIVDSAKSHFLQSAESIAKDVRIRNAFRQLVPKIEDTGFQLNMTMHLWGPEEAATQVLRAGNLADMCTLTGLVQNVDRQNVVTHVVQQMLVGQNAFPVADYIAALHLDKMHFSQAISPLVAALLRNPGNLLAQDSLRSLGASEDPENAHTVAQITDLVLMMAGTGPQDAETRVRLVLDTMERMESPDIRTVLLDRLVEMELNNRPMDLVPITEIAAFTQVARTASYGASPELSMLIQAVMKPLEESLKSRVKTEARSQLIGLEFNPESNEQVKRMIETLSRRIQDKVITSNPSAVAQALVDISKEGMLSEPAALSRVSIPQEAALKFVERKLSDPYTKERILAQCRTVYPLGTGYQMVTTDRTKLATILDDMAKAEWTRRLGEIWTLAVRQVVSQVVHYSLEQSLHATQKAELIAMYLREVQSAKTTSGLLQVDDEFVRLCDAAGLDDPQRLKVAESAGLPDRIKREIAKGIGAESHRHV